MKTINVLCDKKFLKLNQVINPEKNVNSYFYAERLGKDSVAFILIDRDTNALCINYEYKPPIDEYINTAFGGSLDKDNNELSFEDYLEKIVIAETREETGFEVIGRDIVYVGKKFVSTQMNQFCYLFVVDVTGKTPKERQPENLIEANSHPLWVKFEDYFSHKDNEFCMDWKTESILFNFYFRHIGMSLFLDPQLRLKKKENDEDSPRFSHSL